MARYNLNLSQTTEEYAQAYRIADYDLIALTFEWDYIFGAWQDITADLQWAYQNANTPLIALLQAGVEEIKKAWQALESEYGFMMAVVEDQFAAARAA